MRSKRRCVLERKQPYSGDEWCSGAETEEEDEKPLSATHREFSLTHTHTHTHTHTRTHTHTHTRLFFGLRGLSIGVMVFILYNLYVLLPYTYPTPKLSPHRRLCAFLNFQKNTI